MQPQRQSQNRQLLLPDKVASVLDLWDGIRTSLLGEGVLPVIAGIDWATSIFVDTADIALLQNTARANGAAISVFDMKMSQNTSRYALAYHFNQSQTVCGTVSTIDTPYLSLGATCHITLSGTPVQNDGVSAWFAGIYTVNNAEVPAAMGSVAVAGATPTLDALATALAAAINTNASINSNVVAVATGAVVAITNISSTVAYKIGSAVGNTGQEMREAGRMLRTIEIAGFFNTHAMRDQVAPAILNHIGYLQLFGLTFEDGTWARILHNSDMASRDGRFQDLWGWQWLITADMGIDPILQLFPVLVPAYVIMATE